MPDAVVLDASAFVDLLLASEAGRAVDRRIEGHQLHAPAHIDAEVLSALGRLHRNRQLSERDVTRRLRSLVDSPIERHSVPELVLGAWRRRHNVRLADALYLELASRLDMPLVTTDARLATVARAELVRP